jgi:hypothetical protein
MTDIRKAAEERYVKWMREQAAGVAETFIPDPHEEHEACEDCAMTRGVAAAIRKIGENE